ncbi:MAG TPA: hypothetical protein VLE43_10325 [Candidatus Saccharimonadia bacterium]|nr:hypothetical protein [Candidatus Saccharimonadia bacterium]
MNFSRLIILLLTAGMLCLGLTQCASTPEEQEKEWAAILEHRLSREWVQQAKVITMGEQTVYFQGEAVVGTELPLIGWAGDITGEVLIVTPKSAVVCTNLTIAPDGGVHVPSKSHTVVKESPNAWEYLIPR